MSTRAAWEQWLGSLDCEFVDCLTTSESQVMVWRSASTGRLFADVLEVGAKRAVLFIGRDMAELSKAWRAGCDIGSVKGGYTRATNRASIAEVKAVTG